MVVNVVPLIPRWAIFYFFDVPENLKLRKPINIKLIEENLQFRFHEKFLKILSFF